MSLCRNLFSIVLIALIAYPNHSCGTRVGNPDDENTVEEQAIVLPRIDFALPELITKDGETNLVAFQTIFHRWARRAQSVVNEINMLLERLDSDGVGTTGYFAGKGVDGNISGYVKMADVSPFEFEAVFCESNVPTHVLRWGEKTSKIFVSRKINQMVSEIDFNKDNVITLNLWHQGIAKVNPNIVTDGEYLLESIQSIQLEDGRKTFRGVNDWYADKPSGKADGYLAGRLESDELGRYVAYYKEGPSCEEFDETSTEDPGWCRGRTVRADSISDHYTKDQLERAWEDLKPIGVHTLDNLKEVQFPDVGSCTQ